MYDSYLDHAIKSIIGRHLEVPLEALEGLCEKVHRPQRGIALKAATQRQSLSILNESSVDCGESVGGTIDVSAAPEVASDDDGSADEDPEPERPRRPRHQSNNRNALPPAVEHLDRLPESAILDIAALKFITGKSRATIYRWIEKGFLPKPRRLGASSNNVWAAGEIRRALSA